MFAKSTVKLDFGTISKLERAQIIALEQTAEYLHTEVVQAQVVPLIKVCCKEKQWLQTTHVHPKV